MNDFVENISVTEFGKGNLAITSLVSFISESKSIGKTIDHFSTLISDTFCPSTCIVFLPAHLTQTLGVHSKECVYGFDVKNYRNVNQYDSWLVKMTRSPKPIELGLSADIINDSLRKEVEGTGVKSYLIINLEFGSSNLGTVALLDTDTSRLWSDTDVKTVLTLSQILSQNLHLNHLEQQIFTKENLLQTAIENSNDGYWYIDLLENRMSFSKQWKNLLGYEENELEESFETFESLIHPDDKDLVLHVLDPYMKIGVGAYECEYRIREKSGNYLWVLTRANVKYSSNGIPIEFVATNTDITSRIEYKRELAKSEAKYESLIGSIHEVLIKVNKEGVITFLNQAWEEHLHLRVDKTLGTEALKYIHPDDRHLGVQMLGTEYKGSTEEYVSYEFRFLGATGNIVWMEVHGSIRFTNDGKLEEINGILINISQRKLEAKAKAASENKLTQISENISDLITEIDESGKYLFVSKAIRGMLGRNAEDILGRSSFKDVHRDDRALVKKNLFDQLKTGAKRVVEQYRVRNGSGEYVWIETVIQPLYSSTGRRTFIAASRDISARRKIQEETKLALQKERDLNELKSRFITMTSHEFRTPLSNIKSSIDILEMYSEELGERFIKPFEKHFNTINSQVDRINNLLANIDTLGKIDAVEAPFEPKKQNIEEFIHTIINENVEESFGGRSLDLEVNGDQKIVVFDPLLMRTLLWNVVKNAFLYSKEENPTCILNLNDTQYSIIISDKGLGIPKDEMTHLFTSFFRAKNILNLNIPGNGLGLVIAKRITDLHGGTISIESVENEGTTVVITIPNEQE